MRDKSLFPGDTPTIAGEIAVFADHAVTRHDDGNWIRGAGACHGSNSRRLADCTGHLRVRTCGSGGNPPQFFPYAALERCGLNVRRQIKPRLAAAQMVNDLAHPIFEATVIALDLRARIFAPQL